MRGGRATKHLGCCNHNVRFGDDRLHSLALRLQLLRCEFPGVAILRLAGFTEIYLNKPGTERLHLFGNHRAGVEGLDARAQSFGGCNGLQSGNTRRQ